MNRCGLAALVALGSLVLACQTPEPVGPQPAYRPPVVNQGGPYLQPVSSAPAPAAASAPATSAVPTPTAPAPEAPPPDTPHRVACTLEPLERGAKLVGCGATHEEACRAAVASADDIESAEIYRVDGMKVSDLLHALSSDEWTPLASGERATCRVELDLHAKGVNAKGYGADRDAAEARAHRDACRKLPGRCRPGVASKAILCGPSGEADAPAPHWCLVHLRGPKLGRRDITRSSDHGWADACRRAHTVAAKGAPEVAIRHIDGIPHAGLYTGLMVFSLGSLNSANGDAGTLIEFSDPQPCR